MPLSNRNLPKIQHFGRPLRRSYPTPGPGIPSPISRREPAPPPVVVGLRSYTDLLEQRTTDYNPPLHHEYR